MKSEPFDVILQTILKRVKSVLGAKADEYARGDRLSNFKRAAALLNSTPEKALVGMLTKHWVSILDLVDDLDSGRRASDEMWDEKIIDIINYMILLKALTVERDTK